MSEKTIAETLADNQQDIYDIIDECRSRLKDVLSICYDRDTNELFDVNPDDDLEALCQCATRIQSIKDLQATFPPKYTLINSTSLYGKQKNTYNVIQYCNNLLRYTLKRNNIDFGYVNAQNPGCNQTRELIRYIGQIRSVKAYEKYLTSIEWTDNKDLLATFLSFDELDNDSDLITELALNTDGNLLATVEIFDDVEYSRIIISSIDTTDEGNLEYHRIIDVE